MQTRPSAGDVMRCVLSRENTARWLAGHAVLHATLTYQAGRVARKYLCTIVLVGADGTELRTFEPTTAPRSTAYQFHVAAR